MLMSKSRLEKFLYALYSLDYSDLPTPLSRIEELYNCLVTGAEVPTFEPLSRVEKYLMAILGVYDVNELPLPLSRVEVLLHKLATGNDNLDDIESFLSRHEELLAEIIRNGGIDGDISFLFATRQYTLENTAEQPIKSAILKGDTLVNLSPNKSVDYTVSAVFSYTQLFKLDTIYTIIYDVIANDNNVHIMVNNIETEFYDTEMWSYYVDSSVGHHQMTFTYSGDYDFFNWWANPSDSRVIIDNIIILEGDHTQEDIPYFEGMQSVENPVVTTTGKNLFNINGGLIATSVTYSINGDSLTLIGNWFARQVVDLKPNTTYTLSYGKAESDNGFARMSVYFNGTSSMLAISATSELTFTTPSSFNDISVIFYAKEGGDTNTVTYTKIQLEEGSVATEYEPYKSTTVTCNEDVELRGIGDVKDELDLLTGELTQRVGEIVLDGSENWRVSYDWETEDVAHMEVDIPTLKQGRVVSADFNYISFSNVWQDGSADVVRQECITTYKKALILLLDKDKIEESTLQHKKDYLALNPIIVQYQLETESVKTVDLLAVDQDGNDIPKPKTFEDITHVTLSSEGLIPGAELEVATKNEEVLNTLSLEMDDISTAQTTLEETSNAQSENVDSTMLATTEIYEGLL